MNKMLLDLIISQVNSNKNLRFELELNKEDNDIISLMEKVLSKYHCYSSNQIPYEGCVFNNTKVIIDSLRYISEKTINKLVANKIYDLLWIKCNDFESSKKAFKGFCDIINSEDDYEQNYFLFMRCVNIFESTKQNDLMFDFNKTVNAIVKQGEYDTSVLSFNVLKQILEKNYLADLEIIPLLKNKLELYTSNKDFSLYIEITELLEKIILKSNGISQSKKVCNIKEITELRLKRVDKYLEKARDSNEHPMRRTEFMKNAILELKTINGTEEERTKLHGELKELQKLVNESLERISHEFDISPIINKHNEILEVLNDQETLYYFLCCCSIMSQEESIEMYCGQNNVYKGIFTTSLLSKDGSVKATLPNSNTEKGKIAHADKACADLYGSYVNSSMTYLLMRLKKRNIDFEKEITSILKENIFVSENRKFLFIKGIMAGFDYDFISAMSILTPQIENAVRNLAVLCGDAVTKIEKNMPDSVLSLEQILEATNLNECVNGNIIYSLKVVFSSVYGFNLRNEIAHGLLDDHDFKSIHMFYGWWLTMRVIFEFCPQRNEVIRNISDKIKHLVL